jgi:hypothetical protein
MLKIKPKKIHPAKQKFSDAGVRFVDAAYTCGVTYSHFMNVMNGQYSASRALEDRINRLIESLAK